MPAAFVVQAANDNHVNDGAVSLREGFDAYLKVADEGRVHVALRSRPYCGLGLSGWGGSAMDKSARR